MATSTLIPLSEYLRTSYRPDCDWVDGEVKERHIGERSHGMVQKFFMMFFGLQEKTWNLVVLPEQRVQTSESHYRIPDICVIRSDDPYEEIVHKAPLLCIEILSKDDRLEDILERVDDYYTMGVEAVWIINPWRRRAFSVAQDGSMLAVTSELTIAGTDVRVPVSEIFAQLTELEK